MPFRSGTVNPDTMPAISTGYYVIDSDDPQWNAYGQGVSAYIDTLIEPGTWKRILSGPRQRPLEYWADPERNVYGGRAYLHNPGDMSDSTDNAFAGPIAIGFPFYMNGIRYDSLYVSTNGLIALSNRRYHYVTDPFGWTLRRDVQSGMDGALSVYDAESDDPRERSAMQGDTSDVVSDDWGYHFHACGGDPSYARGGIRSPKNATLTDSALADAWGRGTRDASEHPTLIAACWDDWQVSVYDSVRKRQDDFGRIYFKRSPSGDKFIIAWFNLTPVGPKVARSGPVMESRTFQRNNRPGHEAHYSVNVQVHLNRRDSSISIHFGDIKGSVKGAQRNFAASEWVRSNATIGVYGAARRQARRQDTGATSYVSPTYVQATEYLYNSETDSAGGVRVSRSSSEPELTPQSNLSVLFKQWRNHARVVDASFAVIERHRDSSLAYTRQVPPDSCDGFEVLSADNRLDGIAPVVRVQILANDIQGRRGVNVADPNQPFRVRVRFVNESGRIRYNASTVVSKSAVLSSYGSVERCDASGAVLPVDSTWNGFEPYDYVRVTFPAYVFIANPEDAVGSFTMYASIDPRDTLGVAIGESWPLDDTLTRQVYRFIRWTRNSKRGAFYDDLSTYMLLGRTPIPNVNHWVGPGVDVVDGGEWTLHALEPSGVQPAENRTDHMLRAPVLRLDRLRHDGNEIPRPGEYGGDELRSVPIDLRGVRRAALSFCYQRAGHIASRARGFSDNVLVGPEHRVVARNVTQTDPFERKPDSLLVEFATPSSDGINGITNIMDWRYDPANLGALYAPAYTVLGGGGVVRGFDSVDHNRQLNRTASVVFGGARYDLDDDGKDDEWHHVYIPIPDSILRWKDDGNRSFRFRIRASCMRNAATGDVVDDNDPFYIDNIALLTDDEENPDLHLLDVRLHWPYTMTPQRQLARVPVSVRLANNAPVNARNVRVAVRIHDKSDPGTVVYRHTLLLDSVVAGECRRHALPPANLSGKGTTEWELVAVVEHEMPDQIPSNDTARSTRQIVVGPSLAYESHPEAAINDVPSYAQLTGRGLCGPMQLPTGGDRTFWYAGQGTMPSQYEPNVLWRWYMPGAISDDVRYGATAGGTSGAAAMRFTLTVPDSLRGYQAWWGSQQLGSVVQYSVVADADGAVGTNVVTGTTLRRTRGDDDLSALADPLFDTYSTVLLDAPVALDSGSYWLVAEQMAEGFHLGASASRSGGLVTSYAENPSYGIMATHAVIDHEYAVISEYGSNKPVARAAFRSVDGVWHAAMGRSGSWPYAHHNATGNIGYVMTWTQGGWIPLLRPFMDPHARPVISTVDTQDAAAGQRPRDNGQNSDHLGRQVRRDKAIDTVNDLAIAPNPASGVVHVRYAGALRRLRVMTMQGVEVRDLSAAGDRDGQTAAWDGCDSHGSAVPSGRYLMIADGSNGLQTAIVTLIR
ncbi:MAG: hypothetical protein FGM24_03450 [Candidatus Kapabacteria bacterium]|nr:hypothetical protein [Candidatus Kapabacteria bacterium]